MLSICFSLITTIPTEILAETNEITEQIKIMELLETYDSMFNVQISATLAGLSLTAGAFLMTSMLGMREPSLPTLKKFFKGNVDEFEIFYKRMNQGPKFLIIGFVFFLINVITMSIVLDTAIDRAINLEIEKIMNEDNSNTKSIQTSIIQKSFSIFAEGIPFGLGLYFLLNGGKRILDFYTKISD